MTAYTMVSSHRSMVFDQVRNDAYAAAIRQLVTPESVVLDLGAGLGILGFIAAGCGARRVFMVDPSPVLDITRQIVQDNGLDDRIECIKGRIEDIDLPQKVDLIISVFTGNFLLEEDLLPSLFHARDRYLKPGGALLPDRAIMRIAPVHAPQFQARNIESWSDPLFGIDYSRARTHAANNVYQTRTEDINAEFLGDPRDLMELDFMTADSADCRSSCRFPIDKTGLCHGFLGWFKTRLGSDWLSTSPLGEDLHWSQKYLPLDPAFTIEAGTELEFELVRPEMGDWTWSARCGGQQQKKSTFLSGGLSLDDLKKSAGAYRPNLNIRGEVAKFVLERLTGESTLAELETAAIEAFAGRGPRPGELRKWIRSLVRKFG
jgi:predicted RNA methylase